MQIQFVAELRGHSLKRVRISVDGRRIAVVSGSLPSLLLYQRFHAGWRSVPAPRFEAPLLDIAFSPDGEHVLVALTGELRAFEFGEEVSDKVPLDFGGDATEIAWLAGEAFVLAIPLAAPAVRVVSIRRSLALKPPARELPQHLPRIAVSGDGRLLAFCHVFEHVTLFDLATGAARNWGETASGAGAPGKPLHYARRLWFAADDSLIAVAMQPRDESEFPGMALRFGRRDGTQQRLLRIPSHMGAVDVAPDFESVAAAPIGRPGEIGIFDAQSGTPIETIPIAGPARDLSHARDGSMLVVAMREALVIFGRAG